MIPNCDGCKEELNQAIFYQDEGGLFLATSKDIPSTYPNKRRHFVLIMVDDTGKIMVQ